MSDEPHDSTVCIKDGASRFGTWTNRFRRRHLPSSAPAGSSSTPNRATRVGALCALTILVGPASLLAASGKQRAAGAPEEHSFWKIAKNQAEYHLGAEQYSP